MKAEELKKITEENKEVPLDGVLKRMKQLASLGLSFLIARESEILPIKDQLEELGYSVTKTDASSIVMTISW